MSNRLGFARGTAYIGTNADQPPNWAQFTDRPPTQYDNQNVSVGDLWLDTSPTLFNPPQDPSVWVLVSLAGTPTSKGVLATWIRFGGGLGDVVSLTGNVGGPVFPDVNGNINTLGDGIGITVVGTPINNTLTWSLVGGGVATQSYLTDDALVEVPDAAGQLKVFGGSTAPNAFININTRRGADVNTVAIDLNNSIIQPFTTADASQGVYSLGTTSIVADRFLHGFGQTNTFVGRQSGNFTMNTANANTNTCIGNQTGLALVGSGALLGTLNTFAGAGAGAHTTDGSASVYVGASCGNLATTAADNSAVGTGSLSALLTGGGNCALGFDTGLNYTGAESGNINIGSNNVGAAGENATIRIGLIAGTAGTNDIFIGQNAGNSTMTVAAARNNVFIGTQAGLNLTTGNQNTVVGSTSGNSLTTGLNQTFIGYAVAPGSTGGQQNTGVGSQALNGLTTGQQNTSVGDGSCFVTTGGNNSCLGFQAGSNYNGAESSNIMINNPGTNAESNTLRIGNGSGAGNQQLNRAFVHGIYGVNPPGGGVQTVVQDMNGQLGTMVGGPPLFATTAFYAWSNGTMGATPFVLGSFEIVPINNVGPAGYDLGGNFNVGTFAYVCPNNGYYWFNAMITTTLVPNTVTECTMGFGALPAPGTFGPMSFNPSTYQSAGPGTGMCFGGSWLSPLLVAGTSVTIQVLYGGAGALPDVEGGSGRTFLQGYQVG